MQSQASESAAVVKTEALPLNRVFVGNLAFRTTDQDLQQLFKDCGEIKAGVIVTRGRRSLGYGFIEFVKPDDASRSVESMNNKDFMGRPLKVELAKDSNERPEGFEQPSRRKEKKPAVSPAPGTGSVTLNALPTNTPLVTKAQGDNPDEIGPGKRRRTRKPRNRKPKTEFPSTGLATGGPPAGYPPYQQVTQQTFVAQGFPQQPPQPGDPQDRPRRTRRRGNKLPVDPSQPPVFGQAPPAALVPAVVKAPRPPPVKREKVMSKTTLFVANLPFSVDEAALAAVFNGFNMKTSHIVKTRNGRSRGYGFVVF